MLKLKIKLNSNILLFILLNPLFSQGIFINNTSFNTISISGYHIREAGSTAAQEAAFTLANGFEYIESALNRGLKIDDFAPQLSFFFNVHDDFFEEIAKFRAARRIWATELKNKYKAKTK